MGIRCSLSSVHHQQKFYLSIGMGINLITGLCIGFLSIMAVQIPDRRVGYMTYKEMTEELYAGSVFLVLYV